MNMTFEDMFYSLGLFVLVALALLTAYALLYGLVWLLCSRKSHSEDKVARAKVVATTFHPETTHTSVGPTFGANGSGMAMMTTTEDEEDLVLLHSKETGRVTIDNADLMDAVTPGEEVTLTYREKFTFWCWSPEKKKFSGFEPVAVTVSHGEKIEC